MKRNLRFKAKYEGKLYDVVNISLSNGSVTSVTIPLKRFPYTQNIVPDELIQFIDRVDANGRKIYEGDYDSDGVCVVWCDTCMGWEFAQIDIPTGDFCISCHRCDGNFFFEDHISEFCVIGNVYE